jgi:hypothetical protein
LPKTLAEIAIDAGLVTRPRAAKAGKLAEERALPLVVVLVRELGVDELALVAAFGKQTRVPLIDPKNVVVEHEALRTLPRDVCARLRVLPMALATDGRARILRVAMADPTDTAAIAELESLAQCELDVSALPLSAIEELVDKGYRQISTVVVNRPGVTTPTPFAQESENSVTAQIAMLALQSPDDVAFRLAALVQLLVAKGVITEAELAEATARLKAGH